MNPEREGVRARIRQARRALVAPSPLPQVPGTSPDSTPLQALEARIAHMEELVQGLQDSVYREAQRHDKLISELEAQLDPAALAAALSKHARDRGL